MLGAIAGDIIGSVYEFASFKEYDFPLFSEKSTFTDDSVLTVAVADSFMNHLDITRTLKKYALRYPDRGYGGSFTKWMHSNSLAPYNSWGNGSAMRTSSIGFLVTDEADLLRTTRDYAKVTHNHPEGIKGAQATAYAIFLARNGGTKEEIRVEKYALVAPKLADWMEVNIPEGFTMFAFPKVHQRRLRTSNFLERLSQEIKRRTWVVRVFPYVQLCLRLISAILMEIREEWEYVDCI